MQTLDSILQDGHTAVTQGTYQGQPLEIVIWYEQVPLWYPVSRGIATVQRDMYYVRVEQAGKKPCTFSPMLREAMERLLEYYQTSYTFQVWKVSIVDGQSSHSEDVTA